MSGGFPDPMFLCKGYSVSSDTGHPVVGGVHEACVMASVHKLLNNYEMLDKQYTMCIMVI